MAISIDSPEAAVAAAPYLLGFQPEDSIVILFSFDGGGHLSMRVDLPPEPDVEWLQAVLNGIPDPVPHRALVLSYVDTVGEDIGGGVADWVMFVLLPLMKVVDVLLISDGTVTSRICTDPYCCDPCGIAVTSLREHPIVAECVAAGMTLLPGRDALAQQLAPVEDGTAAHVRRLLRREPTGDYEVRRNRLERAATGLLTGCGDLQATDVALLARATGDIHVRDPLISTVLGAHESGTICLGTVRTRLAYALTRLPQSHAAPVAATLALLSWADGDGASALVAADRALEADPDNSLAPLVIQALQFGLPPSTWSMVTKDISMDTLRGRRSA